MSRFQPLLPEPGVPISGTGLSSGIMRLAHGLPGRIGYAGDRWCSDIVYGRCTAPALRTVAWPASHRACSRLDGTEPVRLNSFTYAWDASGILALNAGSRHHHSRQPSSFRHRSSPEAPFLDRHYPVSSVLRASPPPCRPGLPLAGFRLMRTHHRQGFPCCIHPPPKCVPPPIPRRNRPVRPSLASLPMAAFPVLPPGRLPHYPFRGLLSVHSRCGPHVR